MNITRNMTKEPCSTSPETTIDAAHKILQENNFRHLPIIDRNGCLLGMVSDRDLRSAMPSTVVSGGNQEQAPPSRSYANDMVGQTPVREIMSKDVVSLNQFSTIDDALILLDRLKVGALPVVDDDNKLIGIFSTRDLIIAYRNLFGLGEKGSALVGVKNDGQARPLSRIVHIMESHDIHFSRIVQSGRREDHLENGIIYIRVNTCNLHAVHTALCEAGFEVL